MDLFEVNKDDDVFQLPLPIGAVYDHLCWHIDLKRARFPQYRVVFMPMPFLISQCVDPFIAMAKPCEEWHESKLKRYIEGQNPDKYYMRVPRVSFMPYSAKKHPILGRFSPLEKRYYMSFTDGRHRTRVAEYLGVKRIPVQMHKQDLALLNTVFKTSKDAAF